MNIEQLRTAGAFVDSAPVKTSITWKEHQFDVHILRLSFGDMERISASGNSTVNLIANAILLGEEKQPITPEDAARLDISLAAKLIEAVNEVNAAPKS